MGLPDENALKESFMAWWILVVSSTSTRRKLQDCWGQSLPQIQVTLLKGTVTGMATGYGVRGGGIPKR